MEIRKFYGISEAEHAEGTVVVIDIFRAASTAACALSRGAKYLIPVSTKEDAFKIKRENPDYILVGEEKGLKIPGFDYGNSPSEMLKGDIAGKIIIHRTTNGTRGLLRARKAEEIIFGSFLIVSAIKEYITIKKPVLLSLVALDGPGSEDDKFAFYLEEILSGKEPDFNVIINYLEHYKGWGRRFLDPFLPEYPKEDFYLSLKLDLFDFLVITEKGKDGLLQNKKITRQNF